MRYLLLDVDGLDPSEGDLDGVSLLQHACRNGHTAIADLLWSMPNNLSGVDVATEMKVCMHMVANHKQQEQIWATEAKESHQAKLELQKEVEELKAVKTKEEQQMRKQIGELMAGMSDLRSSTEDTVRLRKDEQQKISDEKMRNEKVIRGLNLMTKSAVDSLQWETTEKERLQSVIIGLNAQHSAAVGELEEDLRKGEKAWRLISGKEKKAREQLEEELAAARTSAMISAAALDLADAELGALEIAVRGEREKRQASALRLEREEAQRESEREKQEIRKEMRAELERERAVLVFERETMRRDGEVSSISAFKIYHRPLFFAFYIPYFLLYVPSQFGVVKNIDIYTGTTTACAGRICSV